MMPIADTTGLSGPWVSLFSLVVFIEGWWVLVSKPSTGHMAAGLLLLPSADKTPGNGGSNSGQQRRNLPDN